MIDLDPFKNVLCNRPGAGCPKMLIGGSLPFSGCHGIVFIDLIYDPVELGAARNLYRLEPLRIKLVDTVAKSIVDSLYG